MPDKILTTKDEIHKVICNFNEVHYSKTEKPPFGLGQFLCKAVGPYGTMKFSDRVLEGSLTKEDKASINYQEVYELLEITKKKGHKIGTKQPHRLDQ